MHPRMRNQIMNPTPTKQTLLKGNVALAEAAVRAGCEAYFGYPITPQTELLEHMASRMVELDRVFLQAESEVAAINMVYGAAAAGVRVMTSSSSPGISLMQEGFSYIAGSQVPVVIIDVMRGGPGLGNIQPSQSDYNQVTKTAGHGDFNPIVLAPSTCRKRLT
jgi:2-oxoglutarate/2-oxoacid ferredoxin oxidoreductase subunit alpha